MSQVEYSPDENASYGPQESQNAEMIMYSFNAAKFQKVSGALASESSLGQISLTQTGGEDDDIVRNVLTANTVNNSNDNVPKKLRGKQNNQ